MDVSDPEMFPYITLFAGEHETSIFYTHAVGVHRYILPPSDNSCGKVFNEVCTAIRPHLDLLRNEAVREDFVRRFYPGDETKTAKFRDLMRIALESTDNPAKLINILASVAIPASYPMNVLWFTHTTHRTRSFRALWSSSGWTGLLKARRLP